MTIKNRFQFPVGCNSVSARIAFVHLTVLRARLQDDPQATEKVALLILLGYALKADFVDIEKSQKMIGEKNVVRTDAAMNYLDDILGNDSTACRANATMVNALRALFGRLPDENQIAAWGNPSSPLATKAQLIEVIDGYGNIEFKDEATGAIVTGAEYLTDVYSASGTKETRTWGTLYANAGNLGEMIDVEDEKVMTFDHIVGTLFQEAARSASLSPSVRISGNREQTAQA